MAIAGKVSIVPRGEWQSTEVYTRLDLVTFNRNAYLSLKNSTGIQPTNTEYWMLLIENVSNTEIEELQTQIDDIVEDISDIISGTTPVGNSSNLNNQPPSYYATAQRVEDIVDGTTPVSKAKDSQKLNGLTAEEFVSNGNMLINTDFSNPVNTNGLTQYTGYQWTIDKWFVNYDTIVTINDGYITLTGDNNLRQDIEKSLPYSTYTATIRAKSDDLCAIYFQLFDLNGTALGDTSPVLTNNWEEYTFTFTGIPSVAWFGFGSPSRGQNLSFDVEWVKLEPGHIATPYIPPNKEVEKLKCGATGFIEAKGDFFVVGETILSWATNPKGVYKKFVVDRNSYPDDVPRKIEGFVTLDIDQDTTRRLVTYTTFSITGYQQKWTRSIYNNSWYSEWENISDGGNADTVDGVHASDFQQKNDKRILTDYISNLQSETDIRAIMHKVPSGVYSYITGVIDNLITPIPNNIDVIIRWQRLHNSVNNFIYGILAIYSMTSNDVLCECAVFNNAAFTDWTYPVRKHDLTTALAGYLPLDGSKAMSGDLTITGSDNGRVFVNNNAVPHKMSLASAGSGNVGLYDESNARWIVKSNKNGVVYIDGENKPLHTGNSKPTHISNTSPTDTSALWYDTTNKVCKYYKDGAWQQ